MGLPPRRWSLLLALPTALGLVLAAPAPAHATDGAPGLTIAVTGNDPLSMHLVLTNAGSQPCQVVGESPLGTTAYTDVRQGGAAIAPTAANPSFLGSLKDRLRERLSVLAPGSSVDLPLPVVPTGPTGHALLMVTWSPSTGPYGLLFPVVADKPLSLQVAYATPVNAPGAPVCAPGSTIGLAPASAGRTLWWLWAAGGLVLVAAAVVVVVVLRRRGRPRAGVAAGVAILLGLGIGAFAVPPAARADANFQVDPSMQGAFDACMAMYTAPGGDPAGVISGLNAAGVTVSIAVPSAPGDYWTLPAGDSGGSLVSWSPAPVTVDGVVETDCYSLYHELTHALQNATPDFDDHQCDSAVTDDGDEMTNADYEAVRAENALRTAQGDSTQRLTYHGYQLAMGCPDDEKDPTDSGGDAGVPFDCATGRCGTTTADPHLTTIDGRRYSFQAVGEFVLSRQTDGGFEVQVRQQPAFGQARLASANFATAMAVGPDRVEVRAQTTGLVLLVNGAPVPLAATTLPSGGSVETTDEDVVVTWPADGAAVWVHRAGLNGMLVGVRPAADQAGKLEGLLGDFDGDPGNDVRTRGGAPIAGESEGEPAYEQLYPSYADSWRVDAGSSLFSYEPGQSTTTFTDRTFPDRAVTLADLPAGPAAGAFCRSRGITDEVTLADCTLDLALTGQPDFVAAAVAQQRAASSGAGSGGGGVPFTVTVPAAGQKSSITFAGVAGQKVFVDMPTTTLPPQCGVFVLTAPDGSQVGSGCIGDRTAFIDTTTLPATGTYTVSVTGSAPGEAELRVITVTDVTRRLAVDGPATAVHIGQYGAVARLSFDGTAGQKIFTALTGTTLPSQCSAATLRSPTGEILSSGCVLNGQSSQIDATVLPTSGSYTVEIDPSGRGTGDVQVAVTSATDQHATIAPGASVVAEIRQPGAVAEFTFAGTAGQRVAVDITDATLPSQCDGVDLVAPDGSVAARGCVLRGSADGIATTGGFVLTSTGTWTIRIDPDGTNTGTATVSLRLLTA